MRPLLVLLLSTLTLAGPAAAQSSWTGTLIEGGPVSETSWDATDGSLWAVANGVFRSLDNGATWERRTTGMTWTPTTFRVAEDGALFSAGSALGIPRIYSSTDDGATWTETTAPGGRILRSFVVLPADSTIWLFTDGTDIWRTADSGANWATAVGGPAGAIGPGCQPASATLCLVGSTSTEGVFKSTDGGANWAPSSIGLPAGVRFDQFEFDPVDPTTVYAVARNDDGIFKSADSGNSWTSASNGLPADLRDIDDLAISRGESSHLFAALEKDDGTFELFASFDGGDSWDPVSAFSAGPLTVEGVSGARSPTGIVVGTRRGFQRSTDGGASFFESNAGFHAQALSRLATQPLSPSRIYASAADSGPFVSSDGGSTWEERFSGLPSPGVLNWSMDVTPDDPDKVVLAKSDDFYSTIDAGATWSPISSDLTPFGICGFFPTTLAYAVDSDALWVGHAGCHIPLAAAAGAITAPEVLSSDDSGATWSVLFDLPASTENTFSSPSGRLTVHPEDNGVALISSFLIPSRDTVVRRTADDGANWTDVLTLPSSIGYLAMSLSDGNRAYLGKEGIETAGGTTDVFRSDDAGATWSPLTSGVDCVTSIAVDYEDPDTVYVGCQTLWASRDGGTTWQDLGAAGLPQPVRLAWMEVLEVDGEKTLLATSNGGIFSFPLNFIFADGFESGDTSAWSLTVGD